MNVSSIMMMPVCLAAALMMGGGPDEPTRDAKLSDVLPKVLSEFVLRTQADRPIDGLSPEQRALVLAPESDLPALAALLQDGGGVPVDGPITLLDPIVPESAAGTKSTSRVLAGSRMLLVSGEELEPGTEVASGDGIRGGLVVNLGRFAMQYEDTWGDRHVLDAGKLVLVVGKACQKSCAVTCAGEYYACCHSDAHACVYCHCVSADTNDAVCDAGGGPGSTACSVGMKRGRRR